MQVNLRYSRPNWILQIITDNGEILPATIFNENIGIEEILQLTKILIQGDNLRVNVDFTQGSN